MKERIGNSIMVFNILFGQMEKLDGKNCSVVLTFKLLCPFKILEKIGLSWKILVHWNCYFENIEQ